MHTEEEIWKDIPGYEGYYQVSDLGRIKALSRKRRCGVSGFCVLQETIKSPYPQSDGYLQIGLSKDGTKTSHLLHRLVGYAFLPGDSSLEINHKDFDRKNCRAKNLEWATRLENIEYSQTNKRYQGKDLRGLSKIDRETAKRIREEPKDRTCVSLSKIYGLSAGMIGAIRSGKYWSWAV